MSTGTCCSCCKCFGNQRDLCEGVPCSCALDLECANATGTEVDGDAILEVLTEVIAGITDILSNLEHVKYNTNVFLTSGISQECATALHSDLSTWNAALRSIVVEE